MDKGPEGAATPYRWVVLAVFMVNVAVSQIMWLTFASISKEAAAVFTQGNTDLIDLLSLLFMVLMIPLSIPASWFIDRYGLKWGSGIGFMFMGLCGFFRLFSPDYTWIFIFTVGCSIGQPFILNSFTKVASNWFPEKEEVLATGLLTMAVFLGLVIAMFTPDLIMSPYRATGSLRQGIQAVMNIYGAIALAGVILFAAFGRDKPAVPPNPIAAEKKVSMTVGLKAVFRNPNFLLLMCSFFIGLGAFNAILTKIDCIFRGRTPGVDPAQVAGIMGGLLVVGGIFGAVILSALSDRSGKRKIFLVAAMAMCAPLTLILAYASGIWILGASSFAFGFFLVSAMPIGLTYAVEKTHPVPEPTSNGILMLSGQISGIVFVLYFSMPFLALLFGVGAILALFMEEIEGRDLMKKDVLSAA